MAFDDRPEPAKRLQIARESAKFSSARAAADFFGWSVDTYHQHENGTRGIGRASARYAKAFRVSEAWLLTGEGQGPGKYKSSYDQKLSQLRLERPDLADTIEAGLERQIESAFERIAESNTRKKQ
ncbi:helix-turn-helix transcriptional regulator [Mesorhizobium sp.]|uniref:helix-turn-helix domain-containing protein n=1 Tax=Mesorhizobium sp. TaxID=1871066 RepID=UPI000FE961C1|nr:helix-turn-helix transcriptional regulator [Mesorhizobium sp.]RWO90889.1 MAG: XRE family transcriptional regulator [Mesorhizobium sp.]